MKVVVVIADSFVSRFSKPMKPKEVRAFRRKYYYYENVYYIREYSLCEYIARLFK